MARPARGYADRAYGEPPFAGRRGSRGLRLLRLAGGNRLAELGRELLDQGVDAQLNPLAGTVDRVLVLAELLPVAAALRNAGVVGELGRNDDLAEPAEDLLGGLCLVDEGGDTLACFLLGLDVGALDAA